MLTTGLGLFPWWARHRRSKNVSLQSLILAVGLGLRGRLGRCLGRGCDWGTDDTGLRHRVATNRVWGAVVGRTRRSNGRRGSVIGRRHDIRMGRLRGRRRCALVVCGFKKQFI